MSAYMLVIAEIDNMEEFLQSGPQWRPRKNFGILPNMLKPKN